MSLSRQSPRRVDRSRVSLDNPVQTIYWTVKLGATELELRRAIVAVGNDPKAVAEFARALRERRPVVR
jgi:uncharacterized protein DUF3606